MTGQPQAGPVRGSGLEKPPPLAPPPRALDGAEGPHQP